MKVMMNVYLVHMSNSDGYWYLSGIYFSKHYAMHVMGAQVNSRYRMSKLRMEFDHNIDSKDLEKAVIDLADNHIFHDRDLI